MSAHIEVLGAGLANTFQDFGRYGWRSQGVPVSGALDPVLLACANALVGNRPGTAGIEIPIVGPKLEVVAGSLRCALAGDLTAEIIRAQGGRCAVPAWQTASLAAGDVLQVGAVTRGVAYLAFAGEPGFPAQLGSRATYARARLGGSAGRALAAGDRFAWYVPPDAGPLERRQRNPFAHPEGPIRVLAGPQDAWFSAAAFTTLEHSTFLVSREADRMGLRLDGERLEHAGSAEIVSDGVAPGAIQVPADGRPIVLLADCQTLGGYPKIATVIRADLPRLGHVRPGQMLRFERVDREQARQALLEQQAALTHWRDGIEVFSPPGRIDASALYGENLVSGVVDMAACARQDDTILVWEKP